MSDSDDPNAIGPWEDFDGYRRRRFLRSLHPGIAKPMAAAISGDRVTQVWVDGEGEVWADGVLGSWAHVESMEVADALLLRLYPPRQPDAARAVREATVTGVVMALAKSVEIAVHHRRPDLAKEIAAAGEVLVAQIRIQPPTEGGPRSQD